MTYYHHWFEEFVKSKNICVHFYQMKVHFRIYLMVWKVGSNFIGLCLAIRITFVQEKTRVLASQMTEVLSLTRLFITCDQVIAGV